MNYIPLIAICVSSVLSVVAIVISALSLRNSRRAQHHTQIVSFEQRKQEVRQILFEILVMLREANDELNRVTDNKDLIILVALARHKYDVLLKSLDRVPPTPSTQARLDLEQLGGSAIAMNKEVQTLAKKSRLLADLCPSD